MTSELSDVLAFCIMKLRQRLFVSWPVGGFINSAFKIRLEILAFLYFLGIQNASLIFCPVRIAKNITTVSLYCFAIGFSSVRDVCELYVKVHHAEAF